MYEAADGSRIQMKQASGWQGTVHLALSQGWWVLKTPFPSLFKQMEWKQSNHLVNVGSGIVVTL